MRIRSTLASLLVVVAFSASVAGQSHVTGPCKRIAIRAVEGRSATMWDSRRQTFSALKTSDLKLAVLIPAGALRGEHVMELKIFLPDGHLFLSQVIPFSDSSPAEAGGGRSERSIPGYPYPVRERILEPVTGSLANSGQSLEKLTFTLPVGGTQIVSNSLYGQWRAEAFLDGSDQACGRPVTFSISE